MDIDAAVGQHALVAIDVTDAGIDGGHAFQALGCINDTGHEFLAAQFCRTASDLDIRTGCAVRAPRSHTIAQLSFLLPTQETVQFTRHGSLPPAFEGNIFKGLLIASGLRRGPGRTFRGVAAYGAPMTKLTVAMFFILSLI